MQYLEQLDQLFELQKQITDIEEQEDRVNLQKEQIVVLRGKIEDDSYTGGVRVVAESLELMDKVRERLAKRLLIRVHDHDQVDRLLNNLPEIMQDFRGGTCPVVIAYKGEDAGAELQLGNAWHVSPRDALLLHLKKVCGESEVVLEY